MSANRSVQAAQRRRAGPSNAEPAIPGRGPQPSINSAQMFANQSRPGPGPNIPSGRLAGQQYQQQQYQQQHQNQKNIDKLSGITKMTVPQAITLITLRLGALESKMMNLGEGYNSDSGIDPSFLQSIMERLESVEQHISSNQFSNNQTDDSNEKSEINLLKQQLDTIKQSVVQSKSASLSLIKENASLKTQLENLKKELLENKDLISSLKEMTMDNSEKILNLSMATSIDYNNMLNRNSLDDLNHTITVEDLKDDSGEDEIIGTDLKQLIESELNTDI